MLILGGARWNETACAQIARFAQSFGIPVCTSFRRAHLFDALHPNYAGDLGLGANPRLVARIKQSDLVIAAGARLNELTSQGYTLFDIPVPQMKLVHVYPGAEDLGRVYRPHLAIHAGPTAFAAALEGLHPRRPRPDVRPAHQDYRDLSAEQLADLLRPGGTLADLKGMWRDVGLAAKSTAGRSSRALHPKRRQ